MQTTPKLRLLSAAILSSLLLAGCGGGSSSPSAPTDTTPTDTTPTSTTALDGVANKGILKSALVTAEELVGTTWTARGTATTAADGTYSISMTGYTNGPVRVTVSPTASTKMVCDAPSGCTNADGSSAVFGADATLPSTFTMKAIVPPVTATAKTAYITPLTDMAAANLEQNTSTINETTIKQRSSEISTSFGVPDILLTKPRDATQDNSAADANEQRLAAALATVAEMLYQYKSSAGATKTAADFTAALTKLRDSFKDGKFDNTDTFQKADGTATSVLQSVIDTKTAVLANNVISGKISAQVKTEVENEVADKVASLSTGNGTYTPPVISTALLGDTDKAKAIVAQARALGTSLTSMQTPAQNFSTQLETVNKVWNDRSSLMGLYLGGLIESIGYELDNNINAVGTYEIDVFSTLIITTSVAVAAQSTASVSSCDTGLPYQQNLPCLNDTNNNYVINEPQYNTSSTSRTVEKRKTTTVTATVAETTNGLQVVVTKALPTNGSDVVPATNLTFTIPNFTIADLTANSKTLSGASIIVNGTISDTRATMTFNNLTAATTFASSYTGGNAVAEGTVPTLSVASLKGGISLTDSVSGGSFVGNADISLVHPTATTAQPMDLNISKIALDGTFAHGSNSFKASATLNLTNAASFDLAAFSQYEPTKYVYANGTPANAANLTTLATTAGMPSNGTVSSANYSNYSYYYGSSNNQTCFSYQIPTTSYYQSYNSSTQQYEQVPYTSNSYGSKCTTGDVLGFASMLTQKTTGAISTNVQYGYYSPTSSYNSAGGYATFPDFETANNFAQGSLSIGLDANLAGFPNTKATVTVNRSGFPDIGTAVVSLSDAATTALPAHAITISAANTVANGSNAIDHVTVTSLDGTTMDVYKSTGTGINGTIKVNGNQVGVISDQGSWIKISYGDGTFESL
jgi:hypothetical protein